MSKKAIIIYVAVIAVLAIGIGMAVKSLYPAINGRTVGEEKVADTDGGYHLLSAVPSDAFMLLTWSGLGSCLDFLSDSTNITGTLLSLSQDSPVMRLLRRHPDAVRPFRNAQTVVSIHYNGTNVPLIVVQAGRADLDTSSAVKRFLKIADSSDVYVKYVNCGPLTDSDNHLHGSGLLVVSPSENLVNSSVRHISSGESVLSKNGLASALESADGRNTLFIENSYSGKILARQLTRKYWSHYVFLSKAGLWTALSVEKNAPDALVMKGSVSGYSETRNYCAVWRSCEPGNFEAADILPDRTAFMLDLSFDEWQQYVRAYRKYLDASIRLGACKDTLARFAKRTGKSADDVLEFLDVKEIVHADIPDGDDIAAVNMIRMGRSASNEVLRISSKDSNSPQRADSVAAKGVLEAAFGKVFSASETFWIRKGNWLVMGPETVLEDLLKEDLTNLATMMSRNDLSNLLPEKQGTFATVYFSAKPSAVRLDRIFTKATAAAILKSSDAISFQPFVFTVTEEEEAPVLTLSVGRSHKSSVSRSVEDTTIFIPEGPFEVVNCGSGKVNKLAQNKNLSISLTDETGKGLWTIPFSGKICGAVAQIDYFANKKIQFLFATGDKLYLLDRLGRIVSPFPVKLPKQVLLGPAAYDFTGAGGYRAMVLHTDRTLGWYDLHGKVPATWKGIDPGEAVRALPELLETSEGRYWTVRTFSQTLIYPLEGGALVVEGSGSRRIATDSEIRVEDGVVTARCIDDRERTFRLK